MSEERGFLARWSQRKTLAEKGVKLPEPAAPPTVDAPAPRNLPAQAKPDAPTPTADTRARQPAEAHAPAGQRPLPPPTLEEALALRSDTADFSRFVNQGVDPKVKQQALKTLFSDPHFNVMDGLDVYIDDYNKPDPLPAGMLRKMVQSSALGLFDDEKPRPEPLPSTSPEATRPATSASSPLESSNATPDHVLNAETLPDEDPAVRLQPDDGAGPAGDQPGTGEGLKRQP